MPSRILRKRTLEELIRDLEDRISRLERRTSLVIGSGASAFVIEVDAATGNLVARHPSGLTTVLALP